MEFLSAEVILRVVAVLSGMLLARFYARTRVSHLRAILHAVAVLLVGSFLMTVLTRLAIPELLLDAADLLVSFAAGWVYGRHRLDSSIFGRD